MIDKNKNILIVGLGLMGGSYAECLTKSGYKVYALDINEQTITQAKLDEIICNKEENKQQLLALADIIILCLYPSMLLPFVKENVELFKQNVLMTDISGVKSNIVYEIQNVVKNKGEFISMHPMAGRETKGYSTRNPNMFLNANMIVVPTSENSDEAIMFAYDLANELKFKNIEKLSVQEHDEMVGYLSQLPHAIAVALMNCHDSNHLHKYTGDSFRDLTRIAKINENLWSELFISNKEKLIPLIDGFIKELEALKDDVETENIDGLKNKFISSTNKRKSFDK